MILFDANALVLFRNSDETIQKIKDVKTEIRKRGFTLRETSSLYNLDEKGVLEFSLTLRISLNDSKPTKK